MPRFIVTLDQVCVLPCKKLASRTSEWITIFFSHQKCVGMSSSAFVIFIFQHINCSGYEMAFLLAYIEFS